MNARSIMCWMAVAVAAIAAAIAATPLNDIPGTTEVYSAAETDAAITAATNSIKVEEVDFTTSNAVLVATIEEVAPAPGNYLAVSNAAMSARSMTDLGVRGAPQGEGSWFTVNGQILAWNAGSWGDENQAIGDYGEHYLFFGENEIEFYLDENFTCSINSGTNTYIIIGYTNTLAQVSQIQTVPSASDATPLMDGDASAGTTNVWARGDHVHPSDTSKLNGGAAYPAWGDVVPYPSLWVVSYKGRLWRVKSTAEGTMGAQPDVSSDWEQVYLKDLKQDTLPYPTNAIPFSSIVGAPSLDGQTFDFSRNYDIIRATAAIAEALGATVTNNPTAQGGN